MSEQIIRATVYVVWSAQARLHSLSRSFQVNFSAPSKGLPRSVITTHATNIRPSNASSKTCCSTIEAPVGRNVDFGHRHTDDQRTRVPIVAVPRLLALLR